MLCPSYDATWWYCTVCKGPKPFVTLEFLGHIYGGVTTLTCQQKLVCPSFFLVPWQLDHGSCIIYNLCWLILPLKLHIIMHCSHTQLFNSRIEVQFYSLMFSIESNWNTLNERKQILLCTIYYMMSPTQSPMKIIEGTFSILKSGGCSKNIFSMLLWNAFISSTWYCKWHLL